LARQAGRILYGRELVSLRPYKTARGLVGQVTRLGGETAILETVARRVGRRRMQTGDLVQLPGGCATTGLDALAVVVRDRLLTSSPEHGVRLGSLLLPDTAVIWRVDAHAR
jgi:hypothetical protein